jgi:hypothetical protein
MPTDEIVICLFCMGDHHVGTANKRSDAYLYASEVVTIGLLFSLSGHMHQKAKHRCCVRRAATSICR